MAFEDAQDLAAFFDTGDFAVSALYRAGGNGGGVAVSVVPARGDAKAGVFGQPSLSDAATFLARVSEIANPVKDDTLEIDGVLYTIQAKPVRDDTRAIWNIEAAPD